MGFLDVMKKAGDAVKTTIDYGARAAIPEYNDVRELQQADKQPAISVLDPARQPNLRTDRGQQIYGRQQQSVKEQAKSLMNAALYADEEQAQQIAGQLDQLYGKKEYFTKLLKDADDQTNKSLGLDERGMQKQGGRMEKARGRAVNMTLDPIAARLNAGGSILDSQKGLMEKGAEADIDISKQERQLPIEKDKDKYKTDENIRQNKASTDDNIRQHKETSEYDLSPAVVDKKAAANSKIETAKKIGELTGEMGDKAIAIYKNFKESYGTDPLEFLKGKKGKGDKESDPGVKVKRAADMFSKILAKESQVEIDPNNPTMFKVQSKSWSPDEAEFFNKVFYPMMEQGQAVQYTKDWKKQYSAGGGGGGDRDRAVLEELKELNRMRKQNAAQ